MFTDHSLFFIEVEVGNTNNLKSIPMEYYGKSGKKLNLVNLLYYIVEIP